jgi:hypothetical protein
MSLPGSYNLTIYQGQTYTQIFVWTAGPGSAGAIPNSIPPVGASPLPVDLTGYTATLQMRAYNLTTAPLYYDASSNITLGGVLGTIALIIPAANTETFTWWSGFYDLLLTDSSGNVTPLLNGTVTITPAVSV